MSLAGGAAGEWREEPLVSRAGGAAGQGGGRSRWSGWREEPLVRVAGGAAGQGGRRWRYGLTQSVWASRAR